MHVLIITKLFFSVEYIYVKYAAINQEKKFKIQSLVKEVTRSCNKSLLFE